MSTRFTKIPGTTDGFHINSGSLRWMHGMFILFAFGWMIAVISRMDQGTAIPSGYTFMSTHSVYNTNGTLADVVSEPVVSGVAGDRIAEGFLPASVSVLLVFSFFFWLAMGRPDAIKFIEDDTSISGTNTFGTLVRNTLVLPLVMGQLALLARISDPEKVGLIIVLSFNTELLDALFEVGRGVLTTGAGGLLSKVKQEEIKDKTMVRVAEYGILFFTTLMRVVLWLILLTNVSWQESHGNNPSYTYAVFFFVFCLLVLLRLHHWMSSVTTSASLCFSCCISFYQSRSFEFNEGVTMLLYGLIVFLLGMPAVFDL